MMRGKGLMAVVAAGLLATILASGPVGSARADEDEEAAMSAEEMQGRMQDMQRMMQSMQSMMGPMQQMMGQMQQMMGQMQQMMGRSMTMMGRDNAEIVIEGNEIRLRHGRDHGPRPEGDDSATRALRQAIRGMHRDMPRRLSGDPDRDFAAAMIPHHQGAIDMARIQLQYGKDEALRKLAEAIIKAQGEEITTLKAWLEKKPTD